MDDDQTYGVRVAEVYDGWLEGNGDPGPAIEFLCGLAGDGPVLELGVGTGRLALPIRQRSLEVHGIDSSAAMVTRLRAKPGGDRIPVTIGDFADLAIAGEFSLIFVVFHTLFALPSQEEQVRCFANVARHLAPAGVFVVETFVPETSRYTHGQNTIAEQVDEEGVLLIASRHDPVRQVVTTQRIALGKGGLSMYPGRIRYAWPSELDLMARLAGLRLRERWGGWRKEPFTASSTVHVSVYELAD